MSVYDPQSVEDTPQTTIEDWSLHLQRRVMRLLLLHDSRLFHGQFRTFFAESTLPKIPLLQQYDRYIKLLTLSDELLDDIMPRIRRQLSLQTNRTHLQEEAPTHGDIDWQRTMQRNLSEAPGLTPLRFDTRLRERSMASPENVLAVAVLLQYRQELQKTLNEGLNDEALTDAERQLLAGADERAERELAAPYARALLDSARQVDLEMLVEQVSLRLRPGASPYRDLIAWWHHFHSLHIGRAFDERHTSLASRRNDEKTDAWLYELWIALEFAHLLYEAQAMHASDVEIKPDILQFRFTWNNRRFRFIYNRQLDFSHGSAFGWQYGPASRPDYTIEREDPLKVSYQDRLIWREPPIILDAKYYLSGSDPTLTHAPIKKLLGDMQLLGAQYAALFFPHLADAPSGQQMTREVRRESEPYSEAATENTTIRLYKLTPAMPQELLQERLQDVLNYATNHLPDRPAPTCQGMVLDSDSMNASRKPVPANAVVCPKPHIGPGVFDLVDAELDCLKNPRLCHVIGQSILPPLVIRATTREELTKRTNDIRERNDETLRRAEQSGDEGHAEQLRNSIFLGVGRAIEQYVKLRGNTALIEEQFEEWVFGQYWKRHPRCLAEETRRILLSGAYVWDECKQASIDDWAAPAIQYCRALESEIKRRLEDPCPKAYILKRGPYLTLGTVTTIYNKRYKGDDIHNWGLFTNLVVQSQSDVDEFTALMKRLADEHVADYRNQLAHGGPIPQNIAQALRESIIGRRDQPGILCWLAEHLQPAG